MRRRRLAHRLGMITAILTLASAVVSVGAGTASASTCANWTGEQPENPGTGDTFASVADLTPCNVWAVGSAPAGGFAQTLTMQFNGLQWQPVPSSNPGGGSEDNVLTGVAIGSPSDAWAVGEYSNGTAEQTLIEQLGSGGWEQVPSANPGGASRDNSLSGVAIESAKNAWAVGSYNSGTRTSSLIERWNGSTWTRVPSPNPSATDNELTAVTASSATDAWAVGFYVDSASLSQTLILHWNGSTWKRVPSPDAGGSTGANTLSGVAAASASSAFAVGSWFATGQPSHTLIERWNGTSWQRAGTSSLDRPAMSNSLTSVTDLSANNAWAVGSSSNLSTARTLAAHWNGTTWTLVPSNNLGPTSVFTGVAASSPTDVWVVGYFNDLIAAPDFAMAFHSG